MPITPKKLALALNAGTYLPDLSNTFQAAGASGQPLRFKQGVLYTKSGFSPTRFLSALGHRPSKQALAQEQTALALQLREKVAQRYGEHVAALIQWSPSPLKDHFVRDLDARAAATQVLYELGMQWPSPQQREQAVSELMFALQSQTAVDPNTSNPHLFQLAAARHCASVLFNREIALHQAVAAEAHRQEIFLPDTLARQQAVRSIVRCSQQLVKAGWDEDLVVQESVRRYLNASRAMSQLGAPATTPFWKARALQDLDKDPAFTAGSQQARLDACARFAFKQLLNDHLNTVIHSCAAKQQPTPQEAAQAQAASAAQGQLDALIDGLAADKPRRLQSPQFLQLAKDCLAAQGQISLDGMRRLRRDQALNNPQLPANKRRDLLGQALIEEARAATDPAKAFDPNSAVMQTMARSPGTVQLKQYLQQALQQRIPGWKRRIAASPPTHSPAQKVQSCAPFLRALFHSPSFVNGLPSMLLDDAELALKSIVRSTQDPVRRRALVRAWFERQFCEPLIEALQAHGGQPIGTGHGLVGDPAAQELANSLRLIVLDPDTLAEHLRGDLAGTAAAAAVRLAYKQLIDELVRATLLE